MARAMIVSAGASANEYLAARLSGLGYLRPVIVPAAAEARRRMLETDFELIVVNAPLPDEFGHELCADAAAQTGAGVLLLARADACEGLLAPMQSAGVLVMPKPFSAAALAQALQTAAATSRRLARMQAENARLQEKLTQLRLVCRAKCLLVERHGLTEAEAHRLIEKQAMDSRRSLADTARALLETLDPGPADGV